MDLCLPGRDFFILVAIGCLCCIQCSYTEISVYKHERNAHYITVNSSILQPSRSKRSAIAVHNLRDNPACLVELSRLCGTLKSNSDVLTVLECVQSVKDSDIEAISVKCQHEIWSFLSSLMRDSEVARLTTSACRDEPANSLCAKSEPNHLIYCMIDNVDNFKNRACRDLIRRIELAAFSDFRIISKPQFIEDCSVDIDKFNCANSYTNKEVLSQGTTLSCLQQHVGKLQGTCRSHILYLSKLQADNIRLDRQLYVACADERVQFCGDVQLGSGKLYNCLMRHKMDTTMTQRLHVTDSVTSQGQNIDGGRAVACQDQLLRRQKLIVTDYQVSKGLARACKEDIRINRCRRLVSADKAIRLAQILLCLENSIKNGSRVVADCKAEMVEHRKILMEDYRLSPEIVSSCSDDISKYCSGLEVGGKTIHCLMEHSHPRRGRERVSPPCHRALEVLVKETDAGEDWRVDPVLREACKPVVELVCHDTRGGDARVMSCLMEKLGSRAMTEACETALLQIQYFVARDYRLDPPLYRQCLADATRLCHAKLDRADSTDSQAFVLPCLYRYVYQTSNQHKLHPGCAYEVRRVMRQRALSVDLHPDVEEACLNDLALFCFDKTGRGEEMLCLQDKMQELQSDCRVVVSNFTEIQSENIELNPILLSNCKPVMEKHCEMELRSGNAGDLMDCLIENKNEPDVRTNYKCRATIEHHQLISLADYHFTLRFKEACRLVVSRYCHSARTKANVIVCLSEMVRNDTLYDARHRIPKDCRQQLRSQLLQQRENIDLDPRLKEACSEDVKRFCSKTEHGTSQVLECLENINKSRLSPKCHHRLFSIERQDFTDSSSDYLLLTTCKAMVKQLCGHMDTSQALVCLKKYKGDVSFDPRCRLLVVKRMIEQNSDYRFNPALQRSCQPDISKFCVQVIATQPSDSELEGKVIRCLKIRFRERKLRLECEQQLAVVLREAALNYQLNPLLRNLCTSEIQLLCGGGGEDGSGEVEECLKQALIRGQITSRACRLEVAGLIEEAKADIQVDPLLHRACALDISKFCADVPQGAGRHIQCLQMVLADGKSKFLQSDCHAMMLQRIEMFKNADKLMIGMPENLQDLYGQVTHSPSKKYFIVVMFTFVGMIFIIGLFCGRATNHAMSLKRK